MKGCIFTLKEKRQKTKYNIRRMAKKKKKNYNGCWKETKNRKHIIDNQKKGGKKTCTAIY